MNGTNTPAFPGLMGEGLTKREYFAAISLPGLARHWGVEAGAKLAVKAADALIKELQL